MYSGLEIFFLIIFTLIILFTAIFFRKIDKKVRSFVEKTFNVKINIGYNGTWNVENESFIKKLLLETIQLLWILLYFGGILLLAVLVFYLI